MIGWIERHVLPGQEVERLHEASSVDAEPTSGHHVLREPLPPTRVEIVVAHSTPARGRVDDPSATSVDRDMGDRLLLGEEHEVALAEGGDASGHPLAGTGLFS